MEGFLFYILKLIWLFLPAGAANIAASLSRGINFLNIPIDLGREYRGRPIFGPHKTYRGFVFGLPVAFLIVYWQRTTAIAMSDFNLVDYTSSDIWLLALYLGMGAMLGDLVRSFLKRRLGVDPGKVWFPWDQIDWIIGALLLGLLYFDLPVWAGLVAIIVAFFFHIGANYLSYLLKIQNNKF